MSICSRSRSSRPAAAWLSMRWKAPGVAPPSMAARRAPSRAAWVKTKLADIMSPMSMMRKSMAARRPATTTNSTAATPRSSKSLNRLLAGIADIVDDAVDLYVQCLSQCSQSADQDDNHQGQEQRVFSRRRPPGVPQDQAQPIEPIPAPPHGPGGVGSVPAIRAGNRTRFPAAFVIKEPNRHGYLPFPLLSLDRWDCHYQPERNKASKLGTRATMNTAGMKKTRLTTISFKGRALRRCCISWRSMA